MTPKEGREEVVDTVDLAVEAEGWEVASAVPDDGESLVVVLDPNDGRAPDGMRGGFNAAGSFNLSPPDGILFLNGIPPRAPL